MTDTLIERLEAASEGSRELDDEIATILFTSKHRVCIKGLSDEAGGMWMFRYPNGSIGSSLRFTASIDAAMTLVPRGWLVSILRHFDDDGEYFSTVKLTDSFAVGEDGVVAAWGQKGAGKAFDDPTALAICIASLRAREVHNG